MSTPESILAQSNNNQVKEFDADGYFQSQGMTFVSKNDDGTAIIQHDDGTRGTFDPKAVAREAGKDPSADMKVSYNSPATAINDSPVGFVDRFKLSLGNTKGAIGYLKNTYEGATSDAQGNLVVKDKGVWKKVDAEGLGNDDGWKMSEVLGDIADLGGDLLVGAGSAAAGFATGGVGALALAAAGSAGASVTKAAMGRIVGTYDATPEEAIKDVAMDAVLGLGGEAITLGAKATVFPALKKGFASISKLGDSAQNAIASTLSAIDGEGPDAYRNLFANGDRITAMTESYQAEAAKRASVIGAEATNGGIPESASVLYRTIAEEQATNAAKPLVTNIQGNLSRTYGERLSGITEPLMEDASFIQGKLRDNAVSIRNDVLSTLTTADLPLKNGRIMPDAMQTYLTENGKATDKAGATRIANSINSLMSRADSLGSIKVQSAEDLHGVLKFQGDIHDILDKLPVDKQKQVASLGFDSLANVGTSVGNALPDSSKMAYSALQGWYRESKGLLNGVQSAVEGGNHDIAARGLVDTMKASNNGSAPAKNILNRLAEITPGGGQHVQNLADRKSAMALASYKGTEVHSTFDGAKAVLANIGQKYAIPAVNAMSKLQRKASLQGFLGTSGAQLFNKTATLVKYGGNQLTSNPEAMTAAFTTMLGGLQAPDDSGAQ